ncbi:alpha/beta hydrolase fold domain-containing protein [Micromonospora sp. PTRAS2]
MPLDSYLARRLHLVKDLSFENFGSDAEVVRRFMEFNADPAPWRMPEGVTVEEAEVDGPHGPVPVRVYRPTGAEVTARLVWAHGGGFGAGDLQMPEAHMVAAEVAHRATAEVVSVGYRLAVGGVHYPVPSDDVHAVWQWASRRCEVPAALGGASAGATLALTSALQSRDEGGPQADLLALVYPLAHFPVPALDPALAAELAELPPMLRLLSATVEAMVTGYVGSVDDVPPYAFAGLAPLAGLPRTEVLVAECDDLRPSGELLARQLSEAGVPAGVRVATGMPHGFLNRAPSLGEVDKTLDYLAGVLGAAGS